MGWTKRTVELDSASRATLSQLTQAIALLVTSIKQTGTTMATATELLTAELARFTSVESTLAAAVAAVATALQADAAKITDLVNQLAASSDAAILALVPEFDAVAAKLEADATALQTAVPPASTTPAA